MVKIRTRLLLMLLLCCGLGLYLLSLEGSANPAAAGQIFFLVLFSYSFFLKGITGLTVAVGSVITLAILMKVTAHVDWDKVFAEDGRKSAASRPTTATVTPPPLPGAHAS